MQILPNVSHTFKQNQAPTVASSVGYGTSFPVWPSPSAMFCAPVLVHKIPKTFIQNASLQLISHHLPWTNSELNVTWLSKQNHD